MDDLDFLEDLIPDDEPGCAILVAIVVILVVIYICYKYYTHQPL